MIRRCVPDRVPGLSFRQFSRVLEIFPFKNRKQFNPTLLPALALATPSTTHTER